MVLSIFLVDQWLKDVGTLGKKVTGNSTNGDISAPVGSEIVYQGSAPLVIAGSKPVVGQNVTINNAAGVTLNTPLEVTGTLTFSSRIIDATSQPVVLSGTATVLGTSDASHVNGTVIKEGLGPFTYPVGDGNRYHKVTFNATTNDFGIAVRYQAGNGGTGSYTAAGSDQTPLERHDSNEYWDIVPNGTAAGTVTLYWDGQATSNTTPLTARRVAHFKSGDWVNEGGSAVGSLASGSITSNVISSFSPFALGSVPAVLPVRFGALTAKLEGNRTKLDWNTFSEVNNSHFIVSRSNTEGNAFEVARVTGKGTTNSFTRHNAYDYLPAKGTNYYRLVQVDINGSATELAVVSLDFSLGGGLKLSAYPNPVKTTFHVVSDLPAEASIVTITGQVMKSISLVAGTTAIDASQWPVGIYFLRARNGNLKLVKE